MSQSYTKRVFRGTSTAFIISFIATLVAYLTRVVLTRYMSIEEYGLFSAVLTFVTFFFFLRDLGLNAALAKFIAEWRVAEQFGKIKSVIISVTLIQAASSLVFSAIFFFLAGYLAEVYFRDPRAETMLQLLLIYLLTSVFFTTFKAIFRGFQSMLLFSSVELVKDSLVLILAVLFFRLDWGINSPVLAYVLVSPLLLLIYLFPANKLSRFCQSKKENFYSLAGRALFFGLPLIAVSFEGRLTGYSGTLILTYFRSLSEVGIYNVIQPTTIFLLFLGRAITSIAFPVASELSALEDQKKLKEGVRLLQKYLFTFVLPLVCPVITFSGEIITFIFGAEYASGTVAMQILLIGTLFCLMGMIHHNIISAIGHPKKVAYLLFWGALSGVLLNFVLVPPLGIMGAALAATAGYAVTLFLSARMIKQVLQTPPFLGQWAKQLSGGGLFLAATLLARDYFHYSLGIEVVISLAIALTVYALYLFSFRIVNLGEIKKYGRLI